MNKKKSKKQKQNYSIGIYISRVQSKDTNEKPRFEFYDRKAQTKKKWKTKTTQHQMEMWASVCFLCSSHPITTYGATTTAKYIPLKHVDERVCGA